MKRLAGIAMAVALLGACGSDSDEAADTTSAAAETTDATTGATTEAAETTEAATADTDPPETTEAPATTDAPETTDAPATTEEETTTTEEQTDGDVGVVWNSGVDPSRINTTEGQPVESALGITSSIDMLILLTTENDLCDEVIEADESPEKATQCLLVQFRFDVGPDIGTQYTDTAALTAEDAVTAEGRQVKSGGFPYLDAYADTVGNTVVAVYPFAGPGSTLRWTVNDGSYDTETFVYTAPPAEAFLPLTFEPASS